MMNYIPDRGDVVWLDFTPQTGHEQHGKRPAIVLSPQAYNKKARLALFCPITTSEDMSQSIQIKTLWHVFLLGSCNESLELISMRARLRPFANRINMLTKRANFRKSIV